MRKSGNNIFIIHFHPLELYPPVMNLIDYLGANTYQDIIVITTKKNKTNPLNYYKNASANISIVRIGFSAKGLSSRLINYFLFYSCSLVLLLKHNPKVVLYYETISSWPALFYKKYFKKKVRLMVHYHEYSPLDEYEKGMKLVKKMHKMESKMYNRFSWISHTNGVRLQMFKNDSRLNHLSHSLFHVIPNFPSKAWLNGGKKISPANEKQKLVFVGSLGYDNMYLQEIVDWLEKHPDKFSLDVYSYNIDEKAKQLLENNKFKNIRFRGGCDYQSLPVILKNYDIGLVIYKPFSQNTVYAVSNKVFEYLACGIDVWFSEDMAYTFEYKAEDVYPKVVPVNFKKLDSFDYAFAVSKENLPFQASVFFYEKVYSAILDHFRFKKQIES